ncbi:MAG: sugar dehydrogenase complex small subunit [Rhodopila sp.]|nr:sugar dehydrogenase complex small subunit [Rhodopila sp.]
MKAVTRPWLADLVMSNNQESDDCNDPCRRADLRDPVRRALLATALAAYASTSVRWASAAPAGDRGQDAFLAASKFLTGRSSLDPQQAARLYDALTSADPQFSAGVQALTALIDQQKVDPLNLQQMLDGQHAAFAALPKKIATAWYIGVVGDDENAKAVTFETSLMSVITSDYLKPPSYCYGAYGSWVGKPTGGA